MELKAPWLKFYGDVKTTIDYPEITLWEAVYRTACKYPNDTALIYMNRKITYKEMINRIITLQTGLEKAGVKKGDKVIVCLPNIPQAVYLLYAVNRMGAVVCFVHPLSSNREFSEYLKITESKFVVMLSTRYLSDEDTKDLLKNKTVILTNPWDETDLLKSTVYNFHNGLGRCCKKDKLFSWKEIMKNKGDESFSCDSVSSYSPAVVLFSGGTTGTPKGVLISSFGLNAMALQTGQMCCCEVAGSKMLAVMPVFHGFGLGVCIHAVLIHGGCSVLIPRFSAESFGKSIKKHRPNFIAGVPTMFEALTRCKSLRKADLSCLDGVFSGGDALQEKLRAKFDGYLKEHGATVKLREGYGLTECVTASCLTPVNIQRKGSIGIPFPDTYYKICKANTTQEVPYGEVGEICITGPALMLGYLNNEKETKAVLRLHNDGFTWLHTGDAGMMDEDGFVYFRERIKRIIVTSGYNVYPSGIEEILNAHPKVSCCCVVGVKDSYKMQRVKALVVVCDGVKADENLKAELIAYCRKNIAGYAIPSEIEFADGLPLTKLGKVDFRSLD